MAGDTISPEQVKAARALLAWSQQELANEARVATSTVADFERGSRTPVANNAHAIRAAFEGRGLQFVANGVVEKAMLTQTVPSLRPGNLMRWINATHLSQWGESRDGQSSIPELIRRLIYASLGPSARVSFPSDESVQFPGFDGTCSTAAGSEFVPEGRSVWEFGAQRTNIRGKAEKDYSKRSLNPLGENQKATTFVFVTPQRFLAKDQWVAEKQAEGVWRDVRVIDADELVLWLEMYPGVAHWLAVKLGRRPLGLRNIEEVWAEWLRATKTPIDENILLTDRDDDATAILKWLKDAPRLFAIQGEAPEEVMAFLYAALLALPDANRIGYLSRCMVAEDIATTRQLLGLGSPLIVILTDPDPGLSQRLVDDGHHVFAVCGTDSIAASRRLARPWTFNLQLALEKAGFGDADAYSFSKACGRSLTVLRRLLPAAPHAKPKWADPASSDLIIAMFAGGWDSSRPADKKIVSFLAGCRYDDFEERLAKFVTGVDAPLVRVGTAWKVVSLRDLWTLIGGQVVEAQVNRYKKAFQRVFHSVDPRFDIVRDENYIEKVGQFEDEVSALLRRGLLETLLAVGVYPQVASLVPKNEAVAESIVRQLFSSADDKLWWSLSNDFGRLAEAAPNAFLDALELGLESENPPIMALFRSDPGFMTSREYLSHLLWALELLARSPDYLNRAALVLAHLDEIDPGGKWGNRPSASLRRIFVSWSPQTYATPKQRLKVIDRVIKLFPRVGWNLLNALAPKFHDSSSPSSKPEWRDFAPGEPEAITYPSIGRAAREIGQRLLQQAGVDLDRWLTILEHWGNFEPQWRVQAASGLKTFATGLSDGPKIESIRENIREVLQKNRNFPDAEWSMDESELAPLEEIFNLLAPTTPQEKFRWLFRVMPSAYRPDVSWEDQRREIDEARLQATEVLTESLTDGELFAFAQTITFQGEFGITLAKSSCSEGRKSVLLKDSLVSTDQDVSQMGMGILYGLKQDRGDSWAQDLWNKAITENWGDEAELRIVSTLPYRSEYWTLVARRSPEFELQYWRRIDLYRIPEDSDVDFVVDRLIAADRARVAVAWLGNISNKRPAGSLNGQTMLTALVEAAKAHAPDDSNDTTMFTYYLGLILNRLEVEQAVSEQELVQIEWIYFQALRYSERPGRVLYRALAKDPNFFVDLLKMVFLPAQGSGVVEEPKGTTEQVRSMASQAWAVLHHWDIVPGTKDDGRLDGAALETWVKDARKLLTASGRGEIGDQKIGEILSAAPRNNGQPWPPEEVRDIIELVRSKQLETGFEIGLVNRRGVTVRSPLDGGRQERSLAENYRRDAEEMRFDWPRTAACLDRIADSYDADARRVDEDTEQRDWL